MKLFELQKEYAKQDNRATAHPIYVTVQELVSIGVMAEGYDVICPYGDGETKIEYQHPNLEDTYESVQEIMECLDDEGYSTVGEEDKVKELTVGYIWHPVEFFLTIKGAEEYMKANKHNHGKLRTYVDHFERRNFEMRELLSELGFKTKE